jgi:hypothetical protein
MGFVTALTNLYRRIVHRSKTFRCKNRRQYVSPSIPVDKGSPMFGKAEIFKIF